MMGMATAQLVALRMIEAAAENDTKTVGALLPDDLADARLLLSMTIGYAGALVREFGVTGGDELRRRIVENGDDDEGDQ